MEGLERQYLRECVKALVKAREALLSLDCERACSGVEYGKSDTLTLDAVPEAALIRSLCDEFDHHLPFVTEETGYDVQLRGIEEEVVFFADPMDRSKVLETFLKDKTGIVRDAISTKEAIQRWEDVNQNIVLTGSYGSITATRHHHILFNIMINYHTGRIYVACDAVAGWIDLKDAYDDQGARRLKRTADLISSLQPVNFNVCQTWPQGAGLKFVTFCKGRKYDDNLIASDITQLKSIDDIRRCRLIYDQPGGPARILYLTGNDCGFILSNGEKIGEWLGWLAWTAHSGGHLRAYEITFDSSWTRDGILMAPGQAYTILGNDVSHHRGMKTKPVCLNLLKLGFLKNPSQYRATILVCPSSNEEIRSTLIHERCVELLFKES